MICKKNTRDHGGDKLSIPRINISAGLAGINFIFSVEIKSSSFDIIRIKKQATFTC